MTVDFSQAWHKAHEEAANDQQALETLAKKLADVCDGGKPQVVANACMAIMCLAMAMMFGQKFGDDMAAIIADTMMKEALKHSKVDSEKAN